MALFLVPAQGYAAARGGKALTKKPKEDKGLSSPKQQEGAVDMTVTAELDLELETYGTHRQELLGAAEGRYVLIHGDEVAGTFDSESDAVAEGYKQYGNVPFLVKHIVEIETPLNFVSGRVLI